MGVHTVWKVKKGRFWFCKECGLRYTPPKKLNHGGYCAAHRHLVPKPNWKKWYKNLSPEQKKQRYQDWLTWVENNKKRRREIALASYHRRKKLKTQARPQR